MYVCMCVRARIHAVTNFGVHFLFVCSQRVYVLVWLYLNVQSAVCVSNITVFLVCMLVCTVCAYSVCVCVCYHGLLRAVYIRLWGEDRQVSIENNFGQGVDHRLIVDDQKHL